MSNVPVPTHRVLPTLNDDGSRRRLRPKLYPGALFRKRRIVAWSLLALFVALPFLRVNHEPAVLLDVAQRRFSFFGRTFLATDGVLLMLLLLGIFVAIMAVTAIWGRAFCGWACPQTIYLEFVFRPIERLFEGDRNAQLRLDRDGGGTRRVLKNLTFVLVSILVANVFLSYFVGTATLAIWMQRSPWEHPAGFIVMGVTAGLVFADFAFFREQMCTVACPYARLQSVLLDPNSLIIGYDARRGEPRKLGKPVPGGGDCIDCKACVVACPTGIDIRDGLQLECVACGQCIDACNTIMPKIGKPLDLVRIASQNQMAGGKSRTLRPGVLIYLGMLATLTAALLLIGARGRDLDVTVLRGIGAPFVVQGERIQNQLRVKLSSRTTSAQTLELSVWVREGQTLSSADSRGLQVVAPENPLTVQAMESRTTSVFVLAPAQAFKNGRLDAVVRLTPAGAAASSTYDTRYELVGPQSQGRP